MTAEKELFIEGQPCWRASTNTSYYAISLKREDCGRARCYVKRDGQWVYLGLTDATPSAFHRLIAPRALHGSIGSYCDGCRCADCRAANTAYRQDQRRGKI